MASYPDLGLRLSSVWGDEIGVLVSGACPTSADRVAETI